MLIFSLPSVLTCFGAQKNRLIETVLLSTHNICFGCGEMKKKMVCTLNLSPADVKGRLSPALKTFFYIDVPYHILVASLTLMAMFLKQSRHSKTSYKYMII